MNSVHAFSVTGQTVTIGNLTVSADKFRDVVSSQLASAGEDWNNEGQRNALIDVYMEDPSMFAEDLDAYTRSLTFGDPIDTAVKPTGTTLALIPKSRAIDADIIDDMEDAAENPPVEFLTPEQAAYFAKRDADDWTFVQLAVKTLDPKDALKKHSALGKAALARLAHGKASLTKPNGDSAWDAKKDIKPIFERLETMIRMESCVKTVELFAIVRVHLLVEAIRPFAPKVESLSYGMVKNCLLPLLVFDAEDLTGSIKDGWHVWLKEFVGRQLGSEPMNRDAITESMDVQAKALASARLAKQDPEKARIAEEKAANKKIRADHDKAIKAVSDTVDEVLTDGHVNADEIMQVIDGMLTAHGLDMPQTAGTFNPATCTVGDCKMLAMAMSAHGKQKEMRALAYALGQMLLADSKVAEGLAEVA
jgi:hypothetical protein